MSGIASLVVAASAAIALALGLLHLLYTFRGTRLQPRDASLMAAMQRSPPRITRQTTMWRAWIGFNASHSLGLVLFGLVYGYLALAAPALLFSSVFLRAVGFALLLGYVFLSHRYFFRVPFRGVLLAAALYAAGVGVVAL
jgi:hypothetical protein